MKKKKEKGSVWLANVSYPSRMFSYIIILIELLVATGILLNVTITLYTNIDTLKKKNHRRNLSSDNELDENLNHIKWVNMIINNDLNPYLDCIEKSQIPKTEEIERDDDDIENVIL